MSEYSPAQRTALLDAMQKHEGYYPGSRSYRNNNPGNIEYGDFAKAHGATGSDGRFAIFPDYQSGRNAQEKLLFESPGYKDLTLGQAINRWAPGSENNVPAYLAAMDKALGGSGAGGYRGPGGGGTAGGLGLTGVDPRIAEIIQHASKALPPGYTIRATSGKREQGYGFHPKGMAEDFQIFGPDGKPISNRGSDTTGMYTALARNAYGYQEKFHPELTGQFQWGGQFGTVPGGSTPDLMHFDIGGRRGNITQNSREAIGAALPPASADAPSPTASADAPSLDASAVSMSTSSQGGGFTVPGSGETINLPTFDIKPSAPQTHVAHAAHHLALAHHYHRRGHHKAARHHHHMARKHIHHLAKHHKSALAAVMKNSSIRGPGMGEFQPGDPRNPFGAAPAEKSAAGYIALKKYLETHKVGTEEWDDPAPISSRRFPTALGGKAAMMSSSSRPKSSLGAT